MQLVIFYQPENETLREGAGRVGQSYQPGLAGRRRPGRIAVRHHEVTVSRQVRVVHVRVLKKY